MTDVGAGTATILQGADLSRRVKQTSDARDLRNTMEQYHEILGSGPGQVDPVLMPALDVGLWPCDRLRKAGLSVPGQLTGSQWGVGCGSIS